MKEPQSRWANEGIASPALRMGINSGVCKVGNFGTEIVLTTHYWDVRSTWPVDWSHPPGA